MAHFAELDENNIVKRVIVVNNSDCLKNGVEDEATGISFCQALFGGTWIQASYNARFRKHYAGIGYQYNAEYDAFIPPKPYPSWSLDDDCNWQPPVAHPSDGRMYRWDEDNQSWFFQEGF